MRPATLLSAFLLALATPAAAAPPPPARGTVALTFDDLPELALVEDQDYADALTTALLAGLRRHHYPATGFVVGGKLEERVPARQSAILQQWLDAGMELGNHTFSHESPREIGAAAYIADIAHDDAVLRTLLAPRGLKPRWFRHPYLETGTTAAARRAIDTWLRRHGYRVAPVTIVPSDYEFAEPYDAALARHDDVHARALRRAWLSYLQRSIVWYRQAAHALFGRDIAHVLLLHATRLNADTVDDLAAILERNRLKVVPLSRAMRDPAYRTPDTYVGKDGLDWLSRWELTLKKPLPWDEFREPSARIQAEYARVDKDAETTPLTLEQSAPPAAEEEPAPAP
ncbi:MAG: polysaccharide deacetylase family protein [Sphingomonadales bacterium]|nr:polysaccharide deacetylase family protein [Sphingomonadales bacterium]